MNLFSRKLDFLNVAAITVMAISVSIMDFEDLSWDNNYRSYVGLIVFALLLLLRYRKKKQASGE